MSRGSCSSRGDVANEQYWVYFGFDFPGIYSPYPMFLASRARCARGGYYILRHLGYDPCEEQYYITDITVNFV